jgi:hypothetical protein
MDINQADLSSESNSLDIIELTSNVVQEFERLYLSTVGDIDWDQFYSGRLGYVEKVCVVRQCEAIKAALLLAKEGLGHLAVAYVRPACEEYLWLSYLNSVDSQAAEKFIMALMLVENDRSIEAQGQYFGDDWMARNGWPLSYMRSATAASSTAKESIEEIAQALIWPSKKTRGGKGRTPNTKWIASQTDSARLYEFLYSATSRMLHFSPQEILRRGWGNPAVGNSKIELNSPAYIAYRLDFGLYWLVYLLIHTFTILKSGTDQEVLDEEGEGFQQLLGQWASCLGQVPIILPEELNIPQGSPPRSNKGQQGGEILAPE